MSYRAGSGGLKEMVKAGGYWIVWMWFVKKFAFPDVSQCKQENSSKSGSVEGKAKAKVTKVGKSDAKNNAIGEVQQSIVSPEVDKEVLSTGAEAAVKVAKSASVNGLLGTVVTEVETMANTITGQLSASKDAVECQSESWFSWLTSPVTGLLWPNASSETENTNDWPRSAGLNEWPGSGKTK